MIISIEINGQTYRIDTAEPLNIAIPLDFEGTQPNAFDVERASARAYETGNLIGDTRRGGSCNFEEITFVPHCNGTHTESIGHITHARISIHDSLNNAFTPSTLVTLEPENALICGETYAVELNNEDRLITKKSLAKALAAADENFLRGLIIRTAPNDESKKSRAYANNLPPFFSIEAMNYINEKGVRHLLVDTPSIDRVFDEGKLSNHRIFWSVAQGSFEPSAASDANKTVTEMIYAPDRIADGAYLLNLQIAAFMSDASPSRPVLFRICE